MDAKRLFRRFDAWEGRMRGLRPKRYCVPIEPGYRPLLGKERLPHAPLDDARRPGTNPHEEPSAPSLPSRSTDGNT